MTDCKDKNPLYRGPSPKREDARGPRPPRRDGPNDRHVRRARFRAPGAEGAASAP